MKITGRRYDTADCVAVEVAAGRVVSITNIADDSRLPWLAPGLIDLQVNGYGGIGFNDPQLSPEQVIETSLAMDQFGLARYLPTCTTDSLELLARSLATIAQALEQSAAVRLRVPGIHLEGPFICPDDGPRGAHPRQHVRAPDWDTFARLQDAARGAIKLLTLSPEYEGAPHFIERAVAAGVVVAIGHTNANSDQIRAAVDAGARLSTHLGNGAHPQIRRHPNYIWDQLAEDRLMASLIVDGHHLPPAVVKCLVRAKSPQQCVLVSDKTNLAGMPAGRYSTSLGEVELTTSGKLVAADRPDILAGASLPITVNVAKVMQFAGATLREAIDMASVNPARLMGWPLAFLEIGRESRLMLFRCGANAIEIEQLV